MSRTLAIQWMSGGFLVLWSILAINPTDRTTWWLENVLIFGGVATLFLIRHIMPLSLASCISLFFFLCIHAIGAHYTYSLVPVDTVFIDFLGLSRNHYDRFVHLCYGLCLLLPLRELLMLHAKVRGVWSYLLPLDLVMSTSLIYELLEWGAALLFGGGVGAAFLGTQGDEWDAHRDMLMAAVGALLACMIVAWRNYRRGEDMTLLWLRRANVIQ